jgi:hypothetical protein
MQRIHSGMRLMGVNVGKRGGAGAAAGEGLPRSPRGRLWRPRRGRGRRWLPAPAAVRAALVGAGAVVFFGGLAAVGLAAGARLTAGPGSPSLPPGLAPARGAHGPTPQSTFVLTKGQAAMTTTTSTSGLRAARPAHHPGYPRFSGGQPAQPTVPGRSPATTADPRHARHSRHARHPRHATRQPGQARPRSQGQPKGQAQWPRHRARHGHPDHGRADHGHPGQGR